MWRGSASVIGDLVDPGSVFGVLHRDGHRLFPDEMFEDLYSDRGRRSVPPQVVATVMVLQRLHGLSDREAVDAFTFDMRWKYACGGLDLDYRGFVHTVLVDMRARLARSERPRRIFEVVLEAAGAAGLVGARRVLDSTPLYDAVATMDTVTLVRSAIRQVFRAAEAGLAAELAGVLDGADDYTSTAKPQIDWDDPEARAALIDRCARDGYAVLDVLVDGRGLEPEVVDAGMLLAVVLGQDIGVDGDGQHRLIVGVAPDRVISTVDTDARHGHKTAARGFDGYKGHVASDPDSEIITDTVVTPGNAGDASVAEDLVADLVTDEHDTHGDGPGPDPSAAAHSHDHDHDHGEGGGGGRAEGETGERRKVYGDCAYGTGSFQQFLNDHDIESGCRTQPPAPRPGDLFNKDRFGVDLDNDTVTCPAGEVADIERDANADGVARFGDVCAACPMRESCTTSKTGRTIKVGRHEAALAEAREQQANPEWKADYRAVRPKVERKLGHLMHRKHGGRRARVRGQTKVDADFNLLAAAHNLRRLATLGVRYDQGWATG